MDAARRTLGNPNAARPTPRQSTTSVPTEFCLIVRWQRRAIVSAPTCTGEYRPRAQMESHSVDLFRERDTFRVAGRLFFFPENNQCFVDQNSEQPTAKSAGRQPFSAMFATHRKRNWLSPTLNHSTSAWHKKDKDNVEDILRCFEEQDWLAYRRTSGPHDSRTDPLRTEADGIGRPGRHVRCRRSRNLSRFASLSASRC
jgi:hypothetical protein